MSDLNEAKITRLVEIVREARDLHLDGDLSPYKHQDYNSLIGTLVRLCAVMDL